MMDTLVHADHAELRAHLLAGHPIDPAALDDTEYHGISLGLPGWVDRLTWKKFFKVFHRDGATGRLRGLTDNYIRVAIDAADDSVNRIVAVRIVEASSSGAIGQVVAPAVEAA